MSRHQSTQAELRFGSALAACRFLTAARNFRLFIRHDPNWHLQPRVPAGVPGQGGRWLTGTIGAAVGLLPALQRVASVALQRLRGEARRLSPVLRRLPRRWDESRRTDEGYDDETRRIRNDSWQRFGHPTLRFRSEAELRRVLGPAGPGREWHHIVEKRLAGRDGFPAELIHSTDNIVSLPVEVHRRVSARMSMRDEAYENNVRRRGMENRTFAEQYDIGLDLVIETLEAYGHDVEKF